MEKSLRKIESLNGKKKMLLKEFEFTSIKQAKEFYDEKYSKNLKPEKVYEYLKKDYNEIIEQ
jgi:hypothetical protein